MTNRSGLLLVLLFCVPLSGQTPGTLPDSTRTVPDLPAIRMLPVWVPSEDYIATAPDTLYFEYPAPVPQRNIWLKGQRWLGLGMVVLFSSLSYYYHQEAEAAYQDYLSSGDPAELDDLFDQAQHRDRMVGWCYLGAETGLLLVAFSFLIDR